MAVYMRITSSGMSCPTVWQTGTFVSEDFAAPLFKVKGVKTESASSSEMLVLSFKILITLRCKGCLDDIYSCIHCGYSAAMGFDENINFTAQ